MIIDLSSILDKTKDHLHLKGVIDLDSLDLGGRNIEIVGPIKYEGKIYRLNSQIAIDVDILYSYKENCHRCLKPTTNKVKTVLSGRLVKGKEEDEEDQGLDELFYYQNDALDIDEYIYNQVVFSLPMKSLCSPNCKGLCSVCGVDLNYIKCDCDRENIDPRLEKLRNFFPKS